MVEVIGLWLLQLIIYTGGLVCSFSMKNTLGLSLFNADETFVIRRNKHGNNIDKEQIVPIMDENLFFPIIVS